MKQLMTLNSTDKQFRPGILREVQRSNLRETGKAGHHDTSGVSSEHRAGPGRAEGVRHGGGCGFREEGRQGHRTVCH